MVGLSLSSSYSSIQAYSFSSLNGLSGPCFPFSFFWLVAMFQAKEGRSAPPDIKMYCELQSIRQWGVSTRTCCSIMQQRTPNTP